MLDVKSKDVIYTNTALDNASAIKDYLLHFFAKKESDTFFSLLQTFESAVISFPEIHPTASKKCAVLSNALSIFYRIHHSNIEVLAILDNRCDLQK